MYEDEYGSLCYEDPNQISLTPRFSMQMLHINFDPDNSRNPIVESGAQLGLPVVKADNTELAMDILPRGMASGAPVVFFWGKAKVDNRPCLLAIEMSCGNYLSITHLKHRIGTEAENATGQLVLTGTDFIQDERAAQWGRGYDDAHDDKHLAKDPWFFQNFAMEILFDMAGWTEEKGNPYDADYIKFAQQVMKKHGNNRIHLLTIVGALIAAQIDGERRKEHKGK